MTGQSSAPKPVNSPVETPVLQKQWKRSWPLLKLGIFVGYVEALENDVEGCETNQNMKVKLSKVMFINLVFRILLLIYALREDEERREVKKPLQYWLDPLSERVFLIFLNGLQADFLAQNATPFLNEVIESRGWFAVARAGYMETNFQGLLAVLSGACPPGFPFSVLTPYCEDTILDYVEFTCGVGDIPNELKTGCYIPDKYPLQTSKLFPKLTAGKSYKSGLILMVFDLDPVLKQDYQKHLRKIDREIQLFQEVMERAYSNRSTYIVTSARGSPVEGSLEMNSPVIAWGHGINPVDEITFLGKGDLTALLCVLLGINFPSNMFGVIPLNLLELNGQNLYDLNYYTAQHFQKVLEAVDPNEFLSPLSELEDEQIEHRLMRVLEHIHNSRIKRATVSATLVVFLLSLWGWNLILCATSGHSYFFLNIKLLLFLVFTLGVIVCFCSFAPDLLIMVVVTLFWTWQNRGQIPHYLFKKVLAVCLANASAFATMSLVVLAGSQIVLRVYLIPVILWPLINGTFRRLNRFVQFTRLLSGSVLGVLPHNKTIGEPPDAIFLEIVCFLFLLNFYILLRLFKREVDTYLKVNFFLVSAAVLCFRLPAENLFRCFLLCLLLAFSFLLLFAVSGTLLIRLLKTFLSLSIPVMMLSIKMEGVFYYSAVFNLFTWMFMEYHNKSAIDYHLYPSVFSVQPRAPLKAVRFSWETTRHVAFFLLYCYVFYFAIGHLPDLHSYDLYVVPTFIYQYPKLVSYFLGGFKFFLPFFLATTSFITLCGLKDIDFRQLITASVCVSDLFGCYIIFCSQFVNIHFQRPVFPVKFAYFIIQQFAAVSVLFSSFVGEFLLFNSEPLLLQILKWRKNAAESPV